MDISAKLNLSYPAVRPSEQAGNNKVVNESSVSRQAAPRSDASVSEPSAVDDASKVKGAVSEIEKFLSSTRRNLAFTMDEESGQVVVKVIASDTGELIRQLPSEEALRIAHNLNDVNSLLFDAKV